jgi:homotetrameric cytidine deaminase
MQSARKPTAVERDLHATAVRAHDSAYVPHSGFKVGAAIAIGNQIIAGANFENDSYGLTICAERGAIGAAVARGLVADAIAAGADPAAPGCIEAVAVAGDAKTVSPCGACRQVIAQFAGPTTRIIYPRDGALTSVMFSELFPEAFELE